MATRHITASYRLDTDRHGFYTLIRLSDLASAFFQGDDADLWSRNMDAIEGIEVWNAGNTLDKSFDVLCSGYDHILQAPQFTKGFNKFVCVGDSITVDFAGFTATARVYADDCSDKPDQRSDGFWPSKDKAAAGYVESSKFNSEMRKAKAVMKAWENDEWFYCGVAVTVSKGDVELTGRYEHAVWGVECNYPGSDNAYLMELANENLGEAIEAARAKIEALQD